MVCKYQILFKSKPLHYFYYYYYYYYYYYSSYPVTKWSLFLRCTIGLYFLGAPLVLASIFSWRALVSETAIHRAAASHWCSAKANRGAQSWYTSGSTETGDATGTGEGILRQAERRLRNVWARIRKSGGESAGGGKVWQCKKESAQTWTSFAARTW